LAVDHSVVANFDDARESLVGASKATSLLLIEWKDKKDHQFWNFATAFFVAPGLLLTAGHALIEPEGAVTVSRYLFLPGTEFISAQNLRVRGPIRTRCTVLDNAYTRSGRAKLDLAILSTGGLEFNNPLKISTEAVPIEGTIDVVGYPGEKSTVWVTQKHPDVTNLDDSQRIAEVLLPTRRLVVTRGVVQHNGARFASYKISTCPGLSGSCLMYNGKVHGILFILLYLIARCPYRRYGCTQFCY
jgi:V8-like Glu-specific endopeptidase